MTHISKIFFFIFLTALAALAQADLPEKPQSWVNDYAGVLSGSEAGELNGMLAALQQRSSNQIFIAIFAALPENQYVEDFTVKLYEKWKPGLADKDNGLLITVFINDRKMRIEVGYGLEDVVTDAQSGVVVRDYMTPYFKQGDYYGGLKAALTVLIPAAEGKYQIPIKSKKKGSGGLGIGGVLVMILIFFIFGRIARKANSYGMGSRRRDSGFGGPFFWGGSGGSGFGGFSSGGGGGGGGFSGGFGGMSGGGGASGSW